MSRSQLLVDVLHSVRFSVSYLEVLKFEKCAAVSSAQFDGFVSGSELESENRFWQFIADNFDHIEDTNTGLLCETPESEFTMFQPIKKEDISSAKLLVADKFNDNISWIEGGFVYCLQGKLSYKKC